MLLLKTNAALITFYIIEKTTPPPQDIPLNKNKRPALNKKPLSHPLKDAMAQITAAIEAKIAPPRQARPRPMPKPSLLLPTMPQIIPKKITIVQVPKATWCTSGQFFISDYYDT